MALTAEQRTAIALKAVATRRARAAQGTIVFGASYPATPAVEPVELENAEIVRYYDDGWHFAKLVKLGVEKCVLRSIPAYGKQPRNFNVNRADIRPVEN